MQSLRRWTGTTASCCSARTSLLPAVCSRRLGDFTRCTAHLVVFDTPISELALAGAAFGSAITGLRPVVEIMFGDFLPLAMDSLVNQSAKYWFVSNEQQSVPLVVRSAVGGGGGFAAIHSQIPAPWFMAVPGLKIVAPSTPADAKGLLKAAIRDDNPVLFLEHKRLYSQKGNVGEGVTAIGSAAIVRPGTDVTIATAMARVHHTLEAANLLAGAGSMRRSSTCGRFVPLICLRSSSLLHGRDGSSSSRKGRTPAAGAPRSSLVSAKPPSESSKRYGVSRRLTSRFHTAQRWRSVPPRLTGHRRIRL